MGSDDGSTFSIGRFACPGQTLARTALLLAARYLFAKDSPVHLGRQAEGFCEVVHVGSINHLDVTWTSDGIPRSDSCSSLAESVPTPLAGTGILRLSSSNLMGD